MSMFPASRFRPSPATALLDARNFLHSIDVDGDRAIFFRTRSELLREAPFVDGRHPIATSAAFELPLSRLAEPPPGREPTERWLFNCSFCGSTLLSRLLDV